MSQWKGGSQSIPLLEGTVKTPTFLEDRVKFFPTNLYSRFGYGRRAFMKRKTLSTNRHTSPKGYPMRNLVSVDLKLVHSNRSVIIAHTSTWIKSIKVLSWGNFLLTRSCCDLHKACVQALKWYKGNL